MAPTAPIEYTRPGKFTSCSQVSSAVIMGKARKYPKGPSSGFVSGYPQVIETMAESEGFGSSGRVDTEMTASEGSYGPKRKSARPNVDSYERFGVPFQVFSLSRLSHFERRNLEKRFRSELERVKVLQMKIASMPNGAPSHYSSDIHKNSESHIRPPLEHFQMAAEVSTSQGKKRAFGGKNGSRSKQSSAGRGAPKQAVPSNTSNPNLMKQCENLLNKLMTHAHGWVFNTPVDVVKLNIPDYFNVIKHPMDLGTIKSKLLAGEYSSPLGFAADVRLTFSNAKTYNPVGNDVHIMADILSKFFEARWKPIEKKIPIVVDAPVPSTSSIYVEPRNYTPAPPVKKRKTIPAESKTVQEPVKRVVPVVDRQKLSLELEDLLAELPDNIIEFLKKQSQNATQTDEDEIEIDIDALSNDTLLALRKLLDDYLMDKQKKQGRAEPCELELHNESGFSNSSVQPPQGNELVDEDVDIGGNDPPISSYPPVQIEKEEPTLRPDKHSSSSSSSGSSSSDSDSGSSSVSESDGEKAAGEVESKKEVLGSGVDIDQKTNDKKNSDQQDNLLNGSDQAEQNAEPKQETSAAAESQQEGESAPPGRQVSPDKLYRAALLRSRFADTILKAQEKALDKGEKLDPEKLRLEKEELERRRIEEKARLQAEAKAAEEARRKAEADAAAEAKRKRDLEREAARLALQNMEKTVDINENCHFLEDLEMLRGDTAIEQVASLIDEASPDLSENNIVGSFKFQGNTNPLEQLGLYMKMDDEEEEDPEHHQLGSPGAEKRIVDTETEIANDVEDGELKIGADMDNEASPDLSENNIMGNFKFQGNSNPLEQLGLFMKMDDEEDEDAENHQPSPPGAGIKNDERKMADVETKNGNDVEDGEMKLDADMDVDAEHLRDVRDGTDDEKALDAEIEIGNDSENEDMRMDDDVDKEVEHQLATNDSTGEKVLDDENDADEGDIRMVDDVDKDTECQQVMNVSNDEKVLDAENDADMKIVDDVDEDAERQRVKNESHVENVQVDESKIEDEAEDVEID